MKSTEKAAALTLFHDGACPLCQAEILLLKRRARPGQIEFVDVRAPAFDAAAESLSRRCALAIMHGRVGNGPLLRGIDVMAEAYRRTDLHLLSWLFSRTWMRPFLKAGYRVFAANRARISRLIGPALLKLARARCACAR